MVLIGIISNCCYKFKCPGYERRENINIECKFYRWETFDDRLRSTYSQNSYILLFTRISEDKCSPGHFSNRWKTSGKVPRLFCIFRRLEYIRCIWNRIVKNVGRVIFHLEPTERERERDEQILDKGSRRSFCENVERVSLISQNKISMAGTPEKIEEGISSK